MIRDAMINRSEAEWDALQDAIGTFWGWMKEGHVIRARDVADTVLIDKCQREDEEAATDAYNRGYEHGLRERGGDALVEASKRADEAIIGKATERAMGAIARARVDELRAVLQKVGALADEGMATGETRDALNDVKWLVRDFAAQALGTPTIPHTGSTAIEPKSDSAEGH